MAESPLPRDYMSDLTSAEKKGHLEKMSYEDYFVRIFEIHPEALPFLRYMSFRKR